MKMKTGMALLLALGLAGPLHVLAQDEDTMVVIDDDAVVEDVVHDIELPETASPTAVERSAFGLETANQARELGREFGQRRAEEARERGQDAREGARESALEEARERGRGAAGGPPSGLPTP